MRAYLNLRYMDDTRAQLFRTGLNSMGYTVLHGLCNKPERGDIFISWNLIGEASYIANCFRLARRPVIVAENASWGNEFAGERWYHLALNHHNTAGCFPVGGPERWDSLGVMLQPWRTHGETVILPQRGIGPEGTAMPRGWANSKEGRIRNHPGKRTDVKPLKEDLANAGRVVTWGSGAAIQALMWGIRVESDYKNWIGTQDNTDSGRLEMFRKLAWAQWRHSEIASGVAFRHLLKGI